MKLYLIKKITHTPWPYNKTYDDILTLNNWYEGDLTPTMYDPQTLQPSNPYYIVKCNDGKCRKILAEYFITQEELRDKKLKELDI